MDQKWIDAFNAANQNGLPDDSAAALAMLGSLSVFMFIAGLVLVVVLALSLFRIAKKTGTKHAWFAWAPFVGIVIAALVVFVTAAIGQSIATIQPALVVGVAVAVAVLVASFVPLAILQFNIADLSGWWVFVLLLTLIPIIGPIAVGLFYVFVWMRICKACGKPDFLGLFIIIPVLGQIVLPLYLAFSE